MFFLYRLSSPLLVRKAAGAFNSARAAFRLISNASTARVRPDAVAASAFVSLEPSNGDSPMAPAAQAALLMKLRRLRKELLEFCAMCSRGWTATGCSGKCVFIVQL